MSTHPVTVPVRNSVEQMVEALSALADADLDAVVPTELADVLVDLLACGSRLDAVTATVAARVDASRVWANDGSKSAAAWLGRAAHRHKGDAAATLRRGRWLRDMPLAAAEHAAGRLSARHVGLLARAHRTSPDHFAEAEASLVERAKELRFDDFATAIAYWCQLAAPDTAESDALNRYEKRRAHLAKTFDGTGYLDVEFEPVGFDTFSEALRRIEQELWEHDWADVRDRVGPDATKADLGRTDAQRRYDALIDMARRATAMPAGARKPVPLITVHVDHDTLSGRVCELSTGTVVTPGEILPLLCDADIERAVFDGPSRIIDLGTTRRFFAGATRRAVEIVHRRCVHATCAIPAEQCDIHHIQGWPEGPTTQTNGEPRCPTHHPGRRRRTPPGRAGPQRE